jgi:hypothetical protein
LSTDDLPWRDRVRAAQSSRVEGHTGMRVRREVSAGPGIGAVVAGDGGKDEDGARTTPSHGTRTTARVPRCVSPRLLA